MPLCQRFLLFFFRRFCDNRKFFEKDLYLGGQSTYRDKYFWFNSRTLCYFFAEKILPSLFFLPKQREKSKTFMAELVVFEFPLGSASQLCKLHEGGLMILYCFRVIIGSCEKLFDSQNFAQNLSFLIGKFEFSQRTCLCCRCSSKHRVIAFQHKNGVCFECSHLVSAKIFGSWKFLKSVRFCWKSSKIELSFKDAPVFPVKFTRELSHWVPEIAKGHTANNLPNLELQH